MRVVGEEQYPALIIEFCLTIQCVYRLPLRQTVGFIEDLLALMGYADLPVPDYSTLSRRQGSLEVQVSNSMHGDDVVGIAIDSTGLKFYGEGEWKVRQHGFSKHRMWKKMHITINIKTQEILSVRLTSNAIDDVQAALPMIEEIRGQVGRIESSHNDGAYDKFDYRKALGAAVTQVIPPPKNAVMQVGTEKKPVPDYLDQRNEAVKYLQDHERAEWKEMVNYHLRSLNEVVMFRYKITFDSALHARNDDNQETEVELKCKILNVFRKLGMPVSRKVA